MKNNSSRTINDIAKTLNVSPATVSRALSDHPRISDKTKKRVKAQAEALGYRKNNLASALRGKKTYTVGLIAPCISKYFHAAVISSVHNKLHEEGYSLIVCQSNDSIEREKKIVQTLYDAHVDAVLVASTINTTDFSHFDIFLDRGIPLVFYDRVPPDSHPAQLVKGDDVKGGYLATKHLIDQGCKNIAHISGPLSCSLYKDRYAGYMKALQEHQLTFQKDWVFFQEELTPANAIKAMNHLFTASQPYPDALFTANDISALTALQFLKEKALAVPNDIKIVGYSNDPWTSIVTPSITTIEQYPEKIGQNAVEALLRMIETGLDNIPLMPEYIIIDVDLVSRQTA